MKEEQMLHRRLRTLTLLGIVCVLLGCASAPAAPSQPDAADSTTVGSSQGTPRRVLHILGAALTYPGEDAAMHKTIAAFEQICVCTVDARFEGQWTEVPQHLQAAQGVQDAYDRLVQEKGYRFDWPSAWGAADWAKVQPPAIPNIPIGTSC